MDRLGHDFFSRSRFTQNQYTVIGRGDLVNLVADFLNAAADTDQAVNRIVFFLCC